MIKSSGDLQNTKAKKIEQVTSIDFIVSEEQELTPRICTKKLLLCFKHTHTHIGKYYISRSVDEVLLLPTDTIPSFPLLLNFIPYTGLCMVMLMWNFVHRLDMN